MNWCVQLSTATIKTRSKLPIGGDCFSPRCRSSRSTNLARVKWGVVPNSGSNLSILYFAETNGERGGDRAPRRKMQTKRDDRSFNRNASSLCKLIYNLNVFLNVLKVDEYAINSIYPLFGINCTIDRSFVITTTNTTRDNYSVPVKNFLKFPKFLRINKAQRQGTR